MVPPPSVRVAFTVLLLAHTDDKERLLHVLREWIGEPLTHKLFQMGKTQRSAVVEQLLFQGVDVPHTDGDGDPASLSDIWLDYCSFWGMSPDDMDMPFPFFLRSVGRTYQLMARRMLRDIEVASSPNYTKEGRQELLASLRRQAGISKELDEGTEEDWKREREALKRMMG